MMYGYMFVRQMEQYPDHQIMSQATLLHGGTSLWWRYYIEILAHDRWFSSQWTSNADGLKLFYF